jgi:hypothetical protein
MSPLRPTLSALLQQNQISASSSTSLFIAPPIPSLIVSRRDTNSLNPGTIVAITVATIIFILILLPCLYCAHISHYPKSYYYTARHPYSGRYERIYLPRLRRYRRRRPHRHSYASSTVFLPSLSGTYSSTSSLSSDSWRWRYRGPGRYRRGSGRWMMRDQFYNRGNGRGFDNRYRGFMTSACGWPSPR